MSNGIQACDEEEAPEADVDQLPAQLPSMPIPAPEVLGGVLSRPGRPAVAPGVAPAAVRARAQAAVLPFTGSNISVLALFALGLLASGAVTVVATRK